MAFSPGRVFFFKALLQNVGRGLQVDHEVGRRELLAEKIVVAVVSFELLIVQIEAREKFVFFENEIGNNGPIRARPGIERPQLFEAARSGMRTALEKQRRARPL